MTNCPGTHTTYQPSDEDWKCPYCGEDNFSGSFYIAYTEYTNCDLVHIDDDVYCAGCDDDYNAKEILDEMITKKNSCQCPMCEGAGRIDKAKLARMVEEYGLPF